MHAHTVWHMSGPSHTQILAYAILKAETQDMFEWAFRCFAKIFKVAPAAIFTDGDDKIAEAILHLQLPAYAWNGESPVWADTKHCLCVFHLSENFFRHIKPLFAADTENWKKAIDMFWRIAKESDAASRDSFDSDWQQLVDHIAANVQDSTAKDNQLKWLEGLKAKRHKFCARFVWSLCTWGIHSTQRSEAIHSSLKAGFTRRMDISDLIEYLEMHNKDARSRHAVAQELLRMKQAHRGCTTALAEYFHDKLTPYAYKLLLQQSHEALMYDAKQTDWSSEDDFEAGDEWHVTRRVRQQEATQQLAVELALNADGSIDWVRSTAPQDVGQGQDSRPRTTTLNGCSCQFSIAFGGIPCRHEQCVHLRNGSGDEIFYQLLQRVSTKWAAISSDQEATLVTNLRLAPAPVVHQLFTRVSHRSEREQRFKELSLRANAVIELGVRTDFDFDAAMTGLTELIEKLSQLRMPPRGQASDVDAPSASRHQESTMTHPQAAHLEESHTDAASLKRIMGVTYKPCAMPTAEQSSDATWWRSLLKHAIAYKFRPKRSGGWAVGIIMKVGVSATETVHCTPEDVSPHISTALEPDDEAEGNADGEEEVTENDTGERCEESEDGDVDDEEEGEPGEVVDIFDTSVQLTESEVRVYYPSDKTFADHTLVVDDYTTAATASIRSWMLLEQKPLGVAPGAPVRPPRKANRVGKPRSVRGKPHMGPTAARPKKRQRE